MSQDALGLLTQIAMGEVATGTSYSWVTETMSPPSRVVLTPREEVRAWETYRIFADRVEPKVRFNGRCIANGHELRRRRVFMGMFSLIYFQSDDIVVRGLFQQSIGQISIKELMAFCKVRMPPHYYAWAFDVLPLSKQLFGPEALKSVSESPEHVRVFEHLSILKQNLLAVRKVHES